MTVALKATFDPEYEMSPEGFQTAWEALNTESSNSFPIHTPIKSPEHYEQQATLRRLMTIAVGEDENELKHFTYCRYIEQGQDLVCMVEATVEKHNNNVKILAKSESPEFAEEVVNYVGRMFTSG